MISGVIVSLESVCLAAGDDGARATLEPLLAYGAAFDLRLSTARALVAGTSQSDPGFARESAARREAARLGLPIACIEDFPGNYRTVPGAPTRLLVMEGRFSLALYRARLGTQMPPAVIVPPARYDALRGAVRSAEPRSPPFDVLWAGQPETASCLATLEAIGGFLRREDVHLVFRAHPRDAGYERGEYRKLLSYVRHTDATAEPLAATLARPLRLVLTQYSSVAVEAGFLGVPSVHLLFPEAGGALLEAQKAYRVPMPCAEGAAFLVRGPGELATLDHALRDAPGRHAVMSRFCEIYHADAPQAGRLAQHLAGIIAAP